MMLTDIEKKFWLWWNTQDRKKFGYNNQLAKAAFFAGAESVQQSIQQIKQGLSPEEKELIKKYVEENNW